MNEKSSNVVYMQPESKDETREAADETKSGGKFGTARLALFTSVFAVVLMVIFFFALTQNMQGIAERVKRNENLGTELVGVQDRLSTVEATVAGFEDLDKRMKAAVVQGMLREVTGKTSFVLENMDDEERRQKVLRALELLQEVESEPPGN